MRNTVAKTIQFYGLRPLDIASGRGVAIGHASPKQAPLGEKHSIVLPGYAPSRR